MSDSGGPVSIVTQTCVRPERARDFAHWQAETSALIARFPGFIEQRLVPPNPPLQEDWVILQRFQSVADAQRWLASAERQQRLDGVAELLLGRTDVHIVQDDAGAARTAPVTAVISTRVKPGCEEKYRTWERKVAAAQSKARGLQGYRFEPAIPDVQKDCVAILRFDSEANLNAWLESPERRKLLDEAVPLVEEFHARVVRTGFEQWFRQSNRSDQPAPLWKLDMVVLLALYPVVFLWVTFISIPISGAKLGLPYPIAQFADNVVSVTVTGFAVPWLGRLLDWWIHPSPGRNRIATDLLGASLVVGLYAVMVIVFMHLA